jgi:hypothetical protein
MKWTLGIALVIGVLVTTPGFAAGEKSAGKKTDIETCRKLAREKVAIQNGRALNRGSIKAAVQRCKENGPSAI